MKAKTISSDVKGKTTVFWYYQEIFFLAFLEKGGAKKPSSKENVPNKIILYHENSPVHSSTIVVAKLLELGLQYVRNLPCSLKLKNGNYMENAGE